MADVVDFAKRGEFKPANEVNDRLVEHLETMLAQAKSGQLVGAAYAGVYADGSGRTGWERPSGLIMHDALAAGIMHLQYRYAKAMVEG